MTALVLSSLEYSLFSFSPLSSWLPIDSFLKGMLIDRDIERLLDICDLLIDMLEALRFLRYLAIIPEAAPRVR